MIIGHTHIGGREMTLAEQREKLLSTIIGTGYVLPAQADWLLRAISAAGFSIVGPEVTEEMRCEGHTAYINSHGSSYDTIFKAMLAAGDLARKPE